MWSFLHVLYQTSTIFSSGDSLSLIQFAQWWTSLPSTCPDFPWMPAKTAAIITLQANSFTNLVFATWKISLFFWKWLRQLCLTVTTYCIGRDSEQLTPTTLSTLPLISLIWIKETFSVVSLPETTHLEAEYHTYVLAARFKGIREFTKMLLLPSHPAYPHCKISPHTHRLDVEYTQCISHTKLSVGQWSQIFNR